MSAQSKFNY